MAILSAKHTNDITPVTVLKKRKGSFAVATNYSLCIFCQGDEISDLWNGSEDGKERVTEVAHERSLNDFASETVIDWLLSIPGSDLESLTWNGIMLVIVDLQMSSSRTDWRNGMMLCVQNLLAQTSQFVIHQQGIGPSSILSTGKSVCSVQILHSVFLLYSCLGRYCLKHLMM